jgi:hypothetical protein
MRCETCHGSGKKRAYWSGLDQLAGGTEFDQHSELAVRNSAAQAFRIVAMVFVRSRRNKQRRKGHIRIGGVKPGTERRQNIGGLN